MKKEMLINVLQPEECRIAIVEDGILEELYVERTSHESYTGNIYKGKVVNLEPAIQAAFIDFSVGRNGFLHVSDVEPQYYFRHLPDDAELGARDRGRDPRRERDETSPRAPRPAPEDRVPRDRERDDAPPRATRPAAEDRPPRDRDRDRDRPDRSERGRRDRSASAGRRFGEGLLDEAWGAPEPPARSAPILPPSARVEEPARPAEPEPPTPRFDRPETAPVSAREPEPEPQPESRRDPESDEPIGWAPRPRRTPERSSSRFAESRESREREREPEPPSRVADTQELEADLPPSRTGQRSRTAPAARATEASFGDEPPRPRTSSAAPAGFRDEPEPASEPRRTRGRSSRPAREEPRVEPEPAVNDLLAPETPLEDLPEGPRRRGRAAIRSRGGEREPERPRGHAPEPLDEPETAPEPEPELERPRVERPEPRRGRARSADRPRAADSDSPPAAREPRSRPHDRAGEPGYVPRRERSRGEAEPAPFDWLDLEPRRDDPDAGSAEPTDLEGADEGADPARAADGRRRRRRRGRRRDRPEREDAATGADIDADADADADLDADEDDLLDEPAAPSRPGAAASSESLLEQFDFGDRDEEDEEDDDDDEAGSHASGRGEPSPDDEIDPELEEEIRREIEEIAELEREMGLRGTTEARPRRGDELAASQERGERPRAPRGRAVKPPIQEIFRRGDEVLVQVIKESIGTKGPTLSTYISIPGRYLVLMPGLNRVGVSRKIADEGQRRKLREIMTDLNPPKGLGFIVRTAGLDRSKRELARDLAYLLRLWKVILRRIKKARTPAPIYQESDMITRTIRDIFTGEIDTIWIDEPAAFERAQEFLRVVMPKFVGRLRLYEEKVPLFHRYGLEDEIAKIQRRRVEMPEGGSIVIDQTEALVAIDVNSGNFRVENDAEKTAYEMNLRAAKEIARQLRLRDLGGVIVNDFIDMRDERNRRGVEKALRDAIKRDRARTKVLRMSQFGLIEMTRQRIRPSLKRSVYEDCSHCRGASVVKTVESMSIDVMRLLALATNREDVRRVHVAVAPEVAAYLNNRKRREIARIETEANLVIIIQGEAQAPAEHLALEFYDAQSSEIRLTPAAPSANGGRRPR